LVAERALGTTWAEAWERGRGCLAGAERIRVAGASPGVEIAGLDWGGDGELVLMHHANGFCAATLAPIAQALCDRYRVVSIDGRGHGDSTPVLPGGDPDAYAWETLAADVRAATREILERTGCGHVALAIGHSFGGALLLRAASLEPAGFARLLLCDPVMRPPRVPHEDRGPARSSRLAEATRRRRDRFPSREAAFEHCRSRGLFADFTPEALALYLGEGMRETQTGDVALKCDREIEAAIFDGGAEGDLGREVEAVRAEVVFLHAQRGSFSREFYETVAARMSHARVESVSAGHLFPLEEPHLVIERAEAMLRAQRPGAGAPVA